MNTQWIRKYRSNPDDVVDPRPAFLGGGYVTSDIEDAAEFAASALARHGNVVIQNSFFIGNDIDRVRQVRARFKDAERAEARPWM